MNRTDCETNTVRVLTAIVLAGGEGKRMVSDLPKVLHTLCGVSMLHWVLKAVENHVEQPPIVVVGSEKEQVVAHANAKNIGCRFAHQPPPSGSLGAVGAARAYLEGQTGSVIIAAGDLPLLSEQSVVRLCEAQKGHAASRLQNGAVGCVEVSALLEMIDACTQPGDDGELTLSQGFAWLEQNVGPVAIVMSSEQEHMSVNDRVSLAKATAILQNRINLRHMLNGVTFLDPAATYVDETVSIGQDCTLYPGIVLQGNTRIEKNCILYPACRIQDSHIGENCVLQGVVAREAVVKDNVTMGPYVNLRPGTVIGQGCKVGDFVEVGCNSVLNPGTVIGKNSNVYPLSCVRGVIPESSIYKTGGIVVAKK